MSGTQQPEALRLASVIATPKRPAIDLRNRVASELRRQHARISELEAQLSAIGAGGVEPLRKQAAPAALAEQEENQGQYLFDAVLNCPHSITHDAITLHFSPKQKEGYNALSQLRHRLAAADAAAKAREMELLAVIEDLERLIPLINQGEIKA